MRLSSSLRLTPSETLRMNGLALAKKAAGIRVYNLSAGEPILLPHPAIAQAAQQAIDEGKTQYPPVAGIPPLKEAFVQWMKKTYNASYLAKQCVVTCGGKFGIYATFQAILDPGDEVVMVAPYWVSYSGITEIFGGKPIVISTAETNHWKVTALDLERSRTAKTRMLVLNNASNPTGVLYSREELAAILVWAAQHNIIVLSDEVYSGLVYDGNKYVSCGSFPEFQDNVIVIQSCSKHFAMTGWRVGFVLGPENLIASLSALQGQSTTGTSSVSQWAALGALEHADEVIASVRDAMRERRDVFTRTFNKLFSANIQPPAAGLYSFVGMKALGVDETSSMQFCTKLLEEGNIATVPGSAFGQEGYIRFSFGAEAKELQEALEQLAKFLKRS